MADIARIKRNIGKMIDMDAPEADIDAYIAEEGVTLDMLKGQAQPEERPLSMEYKPSEDEQLRQAYSKPAVGEIVKNTPGSAYEFGKNIVTAVTHPIETVKTLGQTALGAGEKLIPGEQGHEGYANAVIDMFAKRYGGLDNLRQTMTQDPVGFLADVSTIFSGVGALPKMGAAAEVGRALEPTSVLLKNPAVAASKLIPESAPRKLYESGMKQSTTLSDVARNKRVDTALKEGIPVSGKGLKKSKGIIAELNDEIKGRIQAHANDLIERDKALAPVEDLKLQYQGSQALPDEAVMEAQKVIDEFKTRPSHIPLEKAQSFKQDLNRRLDDFYKKVSKGGTVKPDEWAEARAALADGLRNEITDILPELKGLNQREGALIELNKSLRQAVNRIENRNILSLLASTYAGAGGIIGGTKGAIVGLLTNYIINNPKVNSRLAIAMHKARQASKAPKPMKFAPARQTAFQAGRIQNEMESAQ